MNTKQRCKACWILSCSKIYTVDNRRKETLEKFKPVNSLDYQHMLSDHVQEGRIDISNLDNEPSSSSMNNTANNSPISNEDEEMDDEEINSLQVSKNESSFPLDFTKKLLDLKKADDELNNKREVADSFSENIERNIITNNNTISNGLNGTINGTINDKTSSSDGENCQIINKDDNRNSKIDDDAQNLNTKNDQNLNSNEQNQNSSNQNSKNSLNQISNLINSNPVHNQSNQKDELNKNNHQFTSSFNNFMQFNNQLNEQFTDWNNNSLPILEPNLNSSNKQDFSDLNDGPLTKKAKIRVKNWSCLKCSNCLAEDCGECINCLDRKKFGGE